MKKETLLRLAEKEGYNVEYKRYEYWDKVLHLNNTAICFDCSVNNGFAIKTDAETFPVFVTKDYIKECVEKNYDCLGFINYKNRNVFGGKVNFKYSELVAQYA